MTLSCLMAKAMIKTVSTLGAELSNTHLDNRLMMFGWNLGMRKNDFYKEVFAFICIWFWPDN